MIKVTKLSFAYKDLNVLEDITFAIPKHSIVTIVGPSACGKSTLLKILSGMIEVDSYDRKLLFERVGVDCFFREKRSSIIFQKPYLLDWRTVAQNISLPLEIRREQLCQVQFVIEKLDLKRYADSYPYELSGGLMQRVSLARALVTKPTVLFMDEPFSSIDELNREKLNCVVRDYFFNKKNKLEYLFFVTHSLEEAVFISDYVIVLSPKPATVKNVLCIDLPKKRGLIVKHSQKFANYVSMIRGDMV